MTSRFITLKGEKTGEPMLSRGDQTTTKGKGTTKTWSCYLIMSSPKRPNCPGKTDKTKEYSAHGSIPTNSRRSMDCGRGRGGEWSQEVTPKSDIFWEASTTRRCMDTQG